MQNAYRCRTTTLHASWIGARPSSHVCTGLKLTTRPTPLPLIQPALPISSPSKRKHTFTTQAAANTTRAVVEGFWPVLVQAWQTDPAALLLGIGTCLIATILSIMLLAAIPALIALRRSLIAVESLAITLEEEVPDTAAAMRLSGMEIADCFDEVSSLGNELTEGVRASARMLTGAERGIKDGLMLASKTMTDQVVPRVKKSAPAARQLAEDALKERAGLDHTEPTLREIAGATKDAAHRLRFLLGAAGLAQQTAGVVRQVGRIRGGRRRRHNSSSHRNVDVLGSMEGA